MIARKKRRRMKGKMNKKVLSLLLVPLMLMPLMGFAYAHWSDRVTKQIKLHAGTVKVDIAWWHVDKCNTYDVSCDGEYFIMGDYPITDRILNPHYDPDVKYELIIENVRDDDDQVIEVYITADPVFPEWELEFKMLIHNKGRLAVQSDIHHWNWTGPEAVDPCWLDEPYGDYPDDRVIPQFVEPDGTTHDIFEYWEELYEHDYDTFPACTGELCLIPDHYTIGPVSETTTTLKPCQCLLLKEYIRFNAQPPPEGIDEYVMCHWFRLAKELGFKQFTPLDPWDSEGWDKIT
jgi:hypothetical protein